MNKKLIVFCSALLLLIGSAELAAVHAGPKIVKIEGAELMVGKSMTDNISVFKGKTITVTLDSGETLSGKVVDVNSRYLHLGELERTNFLDALIDLNHVSAIKAQLRKYAND